MSKPQDAIADAATESEGETALPQKPKRVFRAWLPLGQWDPTTDLEEFIESELTRIAAEKMAVAGITKLSSFKRHETDLHLWKVKDVYRSPASGVTITRYRCPPMTRCKCKAMLRVSRTSSQVTIDQICMHEANSHNGSNESRSLPLFKLHRCRLRPPCGARFTEHLRRKRSIRSMQGKLIFCVNHVSLTFMCSVCSGTFSDWSQSVGLSSHHRALECRLQPKSRRHMEN